MSLDTILKGLRDAADREIEDLNRKAEKVIADLRVYEDTHLKAHGMKRCPDCDGTGAIQRLDAGYMRRFGLREWNGCEKCGGLIEKRGKGYLPGE